MRSPLGQVRIGFRIAQVVDRDDLDLMVAAGFIQRTQNITADTAVAVDGNFHRHGGGSWKGWGRWKDTGL
jgi:hypothetical protein